MPDSLKDPQYAQFLSAAGALAQLVVLSIILERLLAFIFEHDWFRLLFMKKVADPANPPQLVWESKVPGLRGTIALVVALFFCFHYEFDVMAVVFGKPLDNLGIVMTGFIAAGGSAGAIAVFQGFLNFSRDSREALISARKTEAQAKADIVRIELDTRKAHGEAEIIVSESRKRVAESEMLRAELEKKSLAAGNITDPKQPAGKA